MRTLIVEDAHGRELARLDDAQLAGATVRLDKDGLEALTDDGDAEVLRLVIVEVPS